MATGDNVLTAISVARECNIVDSEVEVFLGDIKVENGIEKVVWRSTKNTRHILHEKTLIPNTEFYDDE
jgi:cation-transporting ATPase 13A2